MPFVKCPECDIYYTVQGSGEPILLVHPFTRIGRCWQTIFKNLDKSYQLIIPDIRGHGQSKNQAEIFSFDQAAHDLLTVLDKLQIEKCRAIGMSAGAGILLHMTTKQPSRFQELVVIAGAPYLSQETRSHLSQSSTDNLTEKGWDILNERHPGGVEQIEAIWKNLRDFGNNTEDVSHLLKNIRAKTMIVHGDKDELFPVSVSLEMYDKIPNSSLWVMPNTNHYTIFDKDFDTVQKEHFENEVLRFFNSTN